MPTIYPSDVRPALPREEQCRYLVPVEAAVLGAMAEAINHAVGWRFRRACHCIVGHDASVAVLRSTPHGKTFDPIRVAWRCSAHAEHVCLLVAYQASEGGGTISARLESLTGVSIDPGGAGNAIIWSSTAGDLELAEDPLDDETRYRTLVATTGVRVDDSPAATPTGPRPMNLTALYRGSWVQAIVESSNVRVLSVDVIEMFEAEIEQ